MKIDDQAQTCAAWKTFIVLIAVTMNNLLLMLQPKKLELKLNYIIINEQ